MRTKTYSVFKFSELSPEAKERAKDDLREIMGYCYADEALKSLKALAGHFGGAVYKYSVSWDRSHPSDVLFYVPEIFPSEIQDGLATLGAFNPDTLKGKGDCVLTGYCADEYAIDGFRKAWCEGERDLDKLMHAAFDTWLKAVQFDYAAFYEDNNLSEHCDDNEYEFTEDGKIDRK